MPPPKTRNSNPVPFLSQTAVVIPALNEAGCIRATIQQWLDLGVAAVRVVDNGSTDQTAQIASHSGAEVLQEPRRGYGAAAWRGLQDWPPQLAWVLFSSADGSDRLSPDETSAWQAAIDHGADLVIGDRVTLPASRAHLKPTQRFGNWLACRALSIGWSRNFADMGSLRLLRHRSLLQLALADRAFGWNVEMQVRALEHRWNIVEIPVQYHPRTAGESKISGSLAGTFRAGTGILRTLIYLGRLHRTKQLPAGELALNRSPQ
jgi:glycosyltransferase involved in cell wall biosynthesis